MDDARCTEVGWPRCRIRFRCSRRSLCRCCARHPPALLHLRSFGSNSVADRFPPSFRVDGAWCRNLGAAAELDQYRFLERFLHKNQVIITFLYTDQLHKELTFHNPCIKYTSFRMIFRDESVTFRLIFGPQKEKFTSIEKIS